MFKNDEKNKIINKWEKCVVVMSYMCTRKVDSIILYMNDNDDAWNFIYEKKNSTNFITIISCHVFVLYTNIM